MRSILIVQLDLAGPINIPPLLLREMQLAGNRRGHYQAFVNLLRHASSWERSAVRESVR